MLRLAPGRSPPTDGKAAYHFPVTPQINVHGRTLEELRARIHEFRLRNNIEIGDIEHDIDAYYCSKWPTFCREGSPGVGDGPKAKAAKMMGRITQWVAGLVQKMPRGGYELVLQPEAEARAKICAECPQQAAWRSGCGGCDASTLTLLQQLKKLRRTAHDGSLRGCAIGGWENAAAVHQGASALPLTSEQQSSLPPTCWRAKL